ncbi:mannose-1-phosphate guanylyltransferase/mannose-6-phosphate isomerase [Sulfitobacter mediterraneus]|uniref:mannose-1-phosphate guanylyltransferase/mannose-6-phosphate isomerase n=1 Tax=Sulfitobacter mediterraneus TaxID=83219 RepID=UPI00055FA63D|nr:mannose-1-phosphate guanylyltransferase/mannose-6-phosphate isomerase [Sulfitobacter mediterraneus]
MAANNITPVILCGGSGTRLWPVSRKSFPKQFINLIGDGSLFQQSSVRLSGAGFAAPLIVTNSDFRFIATQQLGDAGIDPGAVLIEPEARNTAPALLAAALVLAQDDPQGLMLAAPSDHYITQADTFRSSIKRGLDAAKAGQIVTFGITPDRPETGYGYLELGDGGQNGAVPLKRFVEKPELAEAKRMLADGGYLWNAGIFMYTAQTLIDAFAAHAPEMLADVSASVDAAKPDLGFLRLDPDAWAKCEDISVDFAIMEKVGNLSVVAHEGDWSDLGGWGAVHQHAQSDKNGVATQGAALAVDCANTLLRSENDAQQLVGLGLENIVAVAMPDAVLVADQSRVAELGTVVKQMRSASIPQADTFPKDHRPWGFFESLIVGEGFQVKRIVVTPGAALSLQSHKHRSEHWIVVVGTAKVTVGPDTDNLDVKMINANESVYIPLGAIHRMENPGDIPMELIEVQTGDYLGEDDIVRYEDVYARGQGAKG